MALHILIGGEARDLQGVERSKREFMHTSVTFIGQAYEALRQSGVERERIIVIAQLQDYLDTLKEGAQGIYNNGIPVKYYQDLIERVTERCKLLISEGGAQYDHEHVNPYTVWRVLSEAAETNAPLQIAVYSHGNSFQTIEGDSTNIRNHEWYFNMPYEAPEQLRGEMYDFVAVEKGRLPYYNVFTTQLRILLHKMFSRHPARPVVCLLNYCRSGSMTTLLSNDALHSAGWPLFLMSSSQATKDSLVSGLWSAWFRTFSNIVKAGLHCSLASAYEEAEGMYYSENVFELTNHVKERGYSREVFGLEFFFEGRPVGSIDPWHLDITSALTSHDKKSACEKLQTEYRDGSAFKIVPKDSYKHGFARHTATTDVIWTHHSDYKPVENAKGYPAYLTAWQGPTAGDEIDLWKVVEKCLDEDIACPSFIHGADTSIANTDLMTWR
eukprot:TRINITY_DN6480_c2_g1_i1.p1 TRINITY_DN6480_c2_g1~~TRINITY_DN6480_c2_g1_i1.p1  ORF type:complete len:454 (+),score=36.40 TRINITY_DN6480_c2_g1_i1:45-1364(+)